MADNNSNLINLNDYFPNLKDSQVVEQTPSGKPVVRGNAREILNNTIANSQIHSTSTYNKGKLQTFGADMDHHQFERYYNHPKFKELGFNPYVDNEAKYNAASSFGDDFRRTWGQWQTLVGLGARDAFSFGPASDRTFAKDFEKAMAIGTSNRGGMGGFVNNLFLNSGYTFGIMGEIIAEEVALWGATALTGGATGELALTRTAENAGRLFAGLFKAEEWAKKANKVTQALDKLADVNTARQVFNGLETGAIATGKFIARNTAGETYNFLSNFNKLENLSGVAKTAQGFGAMYRDIRNVRLAFGESALEGGMVENEMIENLYDSFVTTHGREPDEHEAAKIKTTAKTAALTTTWANLPTIYLSNQIVLGSMMKSFSPLKRFIPIAENQFGRTMLTKSGIEVVEKGFKSAAKGLIQPRTYGKFALDYLSANLAEGLQESAQEVISGTNKQYYKNLYSGTTRGGYYNSIADNIEKQFSPEGLEIFASGFFMGGIVGSAGAVAGAAKENVLKFFDKNYAAKKDAALKDMQRKAKVMDDYYKDPLKYNDKHLNNLTEQKVIQDKMAEAEAKGDSHMFHTLQNRSKANQLWTVLEAGMEDTFVQRFKELTNLSDEELLKAIPNSGDAAQTRADLESMSSKMVEFKKTYDFVKKELPNEFKPWDFKQGTDEYNIEAQAYTTFEAAQKDLIFMADGVKNTLKRMNGIMGEAVNDVGVAGVTATDLTVLFNQGDLALEMGTLRQEIKSFGDEALVTPEAKKLKKDKEAKLKYLEEFNNAIFDVITELTPSETEVNKAIGADSKDIVFTKENFIKAATYNKALSAYKNYVKSRAKGPVSDKNIESAFEKMVDYYKLDMEHNNFNQSVNTLINPKSFYEYTARKKEVMDAEYKDRMIRITEALQNYEKSMHRNDLLQELYKKGVFFNIEEWDALEKEGKMPKRLYKTTGKDQILTTSSAYNDAVDLIRQYSENVNNIPLQYNADLDQYDTSTRDRLPGDNRSYEQLAEQYGFDPKASKTTLPLRQVLQTIIDSEFATEQEQALARRLLKLAQPNETVTFSKELAGPGIYTDVEQTVIDARFSSQEYAENAQSYPIEVSILREEVNRRVYKATEEDPQFRESIVDIMKHATAFYMQEEVAENAPYLGLATPEDFIKEVMTNDNFRAFLSQIEYPETGRSTWGEFVDRVIKMISNLFGSDSTNTALNAAINLITTKIDSVYSEGVAQATSSAQTSTAAEVNPQELSLQDIEATHPELVNELIKLYKDYNKTFADLGNMDMMLDADYASKTDDQIKASPEFADFIKMQNPSIIAAFDKYFGKETTRIIERRPGIKQSITETEQEILLTEQINKLRELGYSDDEIEAMTVLDGLNIIIQGETKEETAARLERERKDFNDDRTEARKEITDMISNAEDFNELEAVEAEILARLTGSRFFLTRTGFKAEDIDALINEKKKELAFKLEFDDVQEGEYLIINNLEKGIQSLWKVNKKTKNQLTLESVKDPSRTYTINRSKFKEDNDKRYIFKYKYEMEDMDIDTNVITPEATDISNDNIAGIEDISDEDVDAAIKAGKSISVDDALDNFFNAQDDACKS